MFRCLVLAALAASSALAQFSVRPSLDSSRYVLTDAHDREVLFRGVNLCLTQYRPAGDDRPISPELYEDGKCPANADLYLQPPICEVDASLPPFERSTAPNSGNDLAQIREAGFDMVRLAISWSFLEPEPGNISDEYLRRIEQVITWGAAHNISFIIDFHQDFYAFSLNPGSIGGYSDGAPAWAVLNETIDAYPEYKKKLLDAVHFDWRTVAAFETFYDPSTGLQEHYIKAFAATVSRFNSNPAVVGFEIMNEPPPSKLRVVDFSVRELYPFYKRTIQAVTGVRDDLPDCPMTSPIGTDCAYPDLGIHTTKVMFFEPMAIRNQLDVSLQLSKPFTEYTNIVYTPHTYTHSFTIDQAVVGGYEQSLSTAWYEATKMRAPVLVTEFGGPTSSMDRLSNITQQQDEHLTGSTFWVWKEKGGGWSMWVGSEGEDDMHMQEDRRRLLARAKPRRIAGQLMELDYDPDAQVMYMVATTEGMDDRGEGDAMITLVYMPVDVKTDLIEIDGAASLDGVEVSPDGSRIVRVKVKGGAGQYRVAIGRTLD
jgi:hypothetical protein